MDATNYGNKTMTAQERANFEAAIETNKLTYDQLRCLIFSGGLSAYEVNELVLAQVALLRRTEALKATLLQG
jgi:hypothetical protein